MKEKFKDILDKDEEIIEVFKPVKSKLYLASFINLVLLCMFFAIPMSIGIASEYGMRGEQMQLIFTVIIGLGVFALVIGVFWFITSLFVRVYYNNLYFAYSNKRIIIRTGVLGVDYKSLDMKMIGAVNVYVSPIDKLHKKNTGSISFGSTASPISAERGFAGYRFSHVSNPYDLYREVKGVIDSFKK